MIPYFLSLMYICRIGQTSCFSEIGEKGKTLVSEAEGCGNERNVLQDTLYQYKNGIADSKKARFP